MTARRIPVWSRVAFVLLLPFAAYSLWDYVEMARLRGRLDAIEKSGVPAVVTYQQPSGGAAESERYFRAAAALAVEDYSPVGERNRVLTSLRDGRWTSEGIEVARATVARNREALALVDRAVALPFTGFLAGTSYNYRVADLMRLTRLCELRAAVAAADGGGDAALASYAAEARLVRALDLATLPVGSVLPSFAGLSSAIDRGKPSMPSRDWLARTLADIDRDNRHVTMVLSARSAALTGPDYRGPVTTHFLVASLDVSAELLVAARQPWPARIDAMNAVGAWPLGGFPPRSENVKTMLRGLTRSAAEQTRRIRCARLLASPTPLDLIDPLTGKRLEVLNCHP